MIWFPVSLRDLAKKRGDDPEALKELFLDPEYPSCCPECNHGVFRE